MQVDLTAEERALEKHLRHQVAASDAALRKAVMDEVFKHPGILRASPVSRWDTTGWYSQVSPAELDAAGFEVAPAELAFPVPPECPWWHDAEVDPRDGSLIRFFVERAWLNLSPPPPNHALVVTIHFHLCPEAIEALTVSLGGQPVLPQTRHADGHGRTVLTYLPQATAEASLRLDLACPIHAVVNEMFPQASDARRLSLAISQPEWVGLEAQ